MHGNQEKETESQQPRVSHPAEAGRRMKEPGRKQKDSNKEPATLEEESGKPRENQKASNKESVTPTKSQSPLKATCLFSFYLSIYLSS